VIEPLPIVTVAEMRHLEASAFAAGVPESALQARAAAEIAGVVGSMAPTGAPLVVVVGPGNNGRDAFLAGRLLASRGYSIRYHLGPRHAIATEELEQLEPGLEAVVDCGAAGLELFSTDLGQAAIVVDGVLGIGARGAPRPPLDAYIRALNAARAAGSARVVSVDIPSGIDADSGSVVGEAVRADVTIALGGVKAGCLRFPAANLTGRIEHRPIGLAEELIVAWPSKVLTARSARELVPDRALDAHKGTLGWVLVLGGGADYIGAPILSAAAAARSGCGLVSLAVEPRAQLAAASALPEATYLIRDPREGPYQQVERILDRLESFDALVVGPGLGRAEQESALVRLLLETLRTATRCPPIVIDADALNVLAGWERWWERIPAGCLLTPHHGEMSRLTGRPADEVAAANWTLAVDRAAAWQQTLILKGPFTTVASPGGESWTYPAPNPALATAGSGDVLAGLTAGLAAQALGLVDAASLAVVTHARAAMAAAERHAFRSLLASDLLEELPRALRELGAEATG
jgi:NAD(P)H-hydrate epimerase